MATTKKLLYTSTCRHCGCEFERPPGRRITACYPCRRARLEANMDASKRRAGPIYEGTVLHSVRYWVAEARRLDIDISDII